MFPAPTNGQSGRNIPEHVMRRHLAKILVQERTGAVVIVRQREPA
jgi:hypothetical protein